MQVPLKIISFNIQAAIGTQSLSHYVTRAHRQFSASRAKLRLLSQISEVISDFDVAFLQEVDLGGRRAGFQCQVEYLVNGSSFTYYATQENRIIGNISKHGNAILSKFPLQDVQDIKLPGRVSGRGALTAKIGNLNPATLVNLHLSLGERDQINQLEHVASRLNAKDKIIVSGDFNCAPHSTPINGFSRALDLKQASIGIQKTYPSWKPKHAYDHVLVSRDIKSQNFQVEDIILSDHLPVSALLAI